jgi:hypothetical protein
MSRRMIFVAVLGALALLGVAAIPGDRTGPAPREIFVTVGPRGFAPPFLELRLSEAVRFVIRSAGGIHSFSVKDDENDPEDIFSVDVPPGPPVAVTFIPGHRGILHLHCRYCSRIGRILVR